MTALILFALTSTLALEPDSAVFPEGLTCRAALDAEVQYGSQPQTSLDRALTLNVPAVFKRLFRGSPASVIYMCNGGVVQARLIYIPFDSQDAAQATFDIYRRALTQQFGKPCGHEAPVSRVEWKARHGAVTSLTLLPHSTGQWQLLVETYEVQITKSPVPSDDPVSVQRHGSSSCEQSD